MKQKAIYAVVVIGIVVFLSIRFFLSGANNVPRPKGYFRIDLPEKGYRIYESACPISIEVPEYAKVEIFRDRLSMDSCWFNIYYPEFNARLHCTYVPVGTRFDELIQDAYGLAASHEMKATALRRTAVDDADRDVYGIVYDIDGEAASQLQFFLTDSSNHFFRGSLYFFNSPNPDSIAPVLSFLRADVMHLAKTLRWK